MTTKPNVIFIVMDALRARNLGCYGYSRETSPNIDKIAKSGVLFESAFSTNNTTNPSFLSIHSGRHLLKKDSSSFIYNQDEMNSFFNSGGVFLQEVLKKNGYKTFCLNPLYTWQKRGFDYFWDSNESLQEKKTQRNKSSLFKFLKKSYYSLASKPGFLFLIKNKITKEVRPYPSGEKATEEAIEFIKKAKESKDPFFMRIDYNDTHTPYNNPGEFLKKFTPEEKGELFFKDMESKNLNNRLLTIAKTFFDEDSGINDIIAKYDSAIAYDDYLIEKVIKTLEETGLSENTYIFFFSDHGESFYEHGIYINHIGLYDTTMNVPLIISGPKITEHKGKRIKSLTQLEDLTPTVLDLLDIPYNYSNFDGQSLTPLIKGKKKKLRESIFMEEIFDLKRRGLRTEAHKYIENNSQDEENKTLEVYDLKKDPNELNNLAEIDSKLVAKLQTQIQDEIKNLQKLNEKRRISKALSKIKV